MGGINLMRREIMGLGALALAAAVAVTGCGSSSPSTPTATKTYKIVYLGDQTGLGKGGFEEARTGVNFAIDQLKTGGDLANIDLQIDYQDTTSSPTAAAPLINQAISSDALAVLGPGLSNEAVALAPLAQRGKIPYLTVQAGSKGVVDVGDFVFRITPPQSSYQNSTVDFLKSKGMKSVYFIYNASLPTLDDLVNTAYPPLLKDAGIKSAGIVSYQQGTTEFSAYISRALATKPDAIGFMTSVAEGSAALSQLRDSGYAGLVFGNLALGVPGTLSGAGAKARGAIWSINFSPLKPSSPSAVSFVNAFRAKNGRPPTAGEAEGYDLVQLLVKGLKGMKGGASRQILQASLLEVTQKGFDGAQGHITFQNRDARVSATVVQWDGSQIAAAS